MAELVTSLKLIFACVGGAIGMFIGPMNALVYTLLAFVILDYITGVMNAIVAKTLNSAVGFKGLFRKVVIFAMVGVANMIDNAMLGGVATLRTAVIFFYLANEGVSLLENASKLGLPVPEKLKEVLEQLKDHKE